MAVMTAIMMMVTSCDQKKNEEPTDPTTPTENPDKPSVTEVLSPEETKEKLMDVSQRMVGTFKTDDQKAAVDLAAKTIRVVTVLDASHSIKMAKAVSAAVNLVIADRVAADLVLVAVLEAVLLRRTTVLRQRNAHAKNSIRNDMTILLRRTTTMR